METKRLLLRNFTLNDIDACYQCWGQDQTLGRYILNYPMTDRQQMAELVQGFLANQDAWVLIDKKRDAVVGCITVDVPYRQLKTGELGYIIGEKYQKQGYASEAAECASTFFTVALNFLRQNAMKQTMLHESFWKN